jgi:hypothetical protein
MLDRCASPLRKNSAPRTATSFFDRLTCPFNPPGFVPPLSPTGSAKLHYASSNFVSSESVDESESTSSVGTDTAMIGDVEVC